MNQRKFVFTLGPSVADPAWLVACAELDLDANPDHATYSDYSEVEDMIEKLKAKAAHNAGYSEGFMEVLETLGVSITTYYELKRLKQQGSVVSIFAKVSEAPEMEDLIASPIDKIENFQSLIDDGSGPASKQLLYELENPIV